MGVPAQTGFQDFVGKNPGGAITSRASYDWSLRYMNSDLGQCEEPAISFQYNSLYTDSGASLQPNLVEMSTDRFYRCPMMRLADFFLKQGVHWKEPEGEQRRLWLYQWEHPAALKSPYWQKESVDSTDFLVPVYHCHPPMVSDQSRQMFQFLMTHPINQERNPSFSADQKQTACDFTSYISFFTWYG